MVLIVSTAWSGVNGPPSPGETHETIRHSASPPSVACTLVCVFLDGAVPGPAPAMTSTPAPEDDLSFSYSYSYTYEPWYDDDVEGGKRDSIVLCAIREALRVRCIF